MNPSQSSSGKLNPSSASFSPPSQSQQPPQTIAPGPEFFTRRSSSTSNQANNNLASARNNQAQKKKHKKSRRPGLGSGNQDADDAFAEASLMRNSTTGRRGQTSITHLMNISLPPRPQAQFHTPRPGNGGSRSYARSGIGSGYHAEDKARYIHANYRFIVHPNPPPTATNTNVTYRPQAMDPDVPLDWNNVLQILVSSESQSSSCPICLGEPVAPRMAKCGHIFCLPCLIRYMHVDDSDPRDAKPGMVAPKRPKYKKCPLCWDSVYMSDTRPVRWFAGQENPAPREGEDVILRLVMRYPGSTLALPREDAEALGQMEDIPWYFAPEVTDYARVMKGTEDYMMEQYDAEVATLREQEKEDELMFGDETTWTKKAVRAVIEAKEKIAGIGNAPEQQVKKGKKPGPVEIKQVDEKNIIDESPATTWTKIHSGELDPSTPTTAAPSKPDAAEPAEPPKMAIEDGISHLSISAKDSAPTPTITAPVSPARQRRTSGDHHPTHAPYYFYQSLPHYYLAPLDIRILKAAYGDFTHLPSTLLPRVEHVSTGHAVDDELRKRTKYLAHLPYGGEVSFLECNWTDVVPDNVLQQFQKEITSRRAKRNEKENREEKARARAEKLEDEERWGRRRKETFAGEIEEERFGADDFVPLPSHNEEGGEGRSPPYATDSRPGFGSLSDNGEHAAEIRRQQSVWGTTVLAAQEEATRAENDGNDGWLLDWEKEIKMEDEAIAAAQAASLAGDGAGAGAGPSVAATGGNGGGQGKKKKKQKITLMSTTARRGL